MKKFFLFFLLSFILLNSGCDNSFDITMGYEEQLVVFLVLDNRTDRQIIKVQKLQNSYGMPVVEKLVEPVSVRIVHPSGYFSTFKDTVISNSSNFTALYIDSLDFKSGVYQLFVNAGDSLYAWSNISIINENIITVSQDSAAYKASVNILPWMGSAHVKPYLVYTVNQNSESIVKSVEVPTVIDIINNDTVEVFSIPMKFSGSGINRNFELLKTSVEYMREKLINYYGAQSVQFNTMRFFVYTYSKNLTDYIGANEGYTDIYSVRLDKPTYTNIVGGMGVFGALLLDSVNVRIVN